MMFNLNFGPGRAKNRAERDALLRTFLAEMNAENPMDASGEAVIGAVRAGRGVTVTEERREPAILIDVSCYQPVWNPARFVELGGDAVIVKATMGYGTDALLGRHVAAIRGVGKILGLYHWLDPTSGVDRQINLFGRAIDEHNPEFVAIDIEQAWKSWSKYWDYIHGQCTWADVPKFTNGEIVGFTRRFAAALHARYPHLIIWIYSGKWFVDAYAPGLGALMNEYLVWLAQYNPQYGGFASLNRVKEIVRHASDRNPVLPAGVTHWDIWQISDAIKIDGLVNGSAVDLNISYLAQDEFMALFGQEQPPVSEVPGVSRGVVNAPLNLRIRAEPNSQAAIVGRLKHGTIIEYYERPGAWLQLADRTGWVFGQFVRRL